MICLAGKQDTGEEFDESPPHIRNVYFKQFMPMSDKVVHFPLSLCMTTTSVSGVL